MSDDLRNVRLLFFDTETTGLPLDYYAPVDDTKNWPHMVQLSWILTDGVGNTIESQDFIIKPCRWKIPPRASRIHGITTDIAKAKGKPIKQVFDLFVPAVETSQVVVGHNIDFDMNIVRAEFARNKRDDVLFRKMSFDTMEESTDFCQIERWDGSYKWPRLQELHMCLFGKSFTSAHNSAADVEATKKCFFEMVKRGIIPNVTQIIDGD